MARKASRKKVDLNRPVKVVMAIGSDVPSYYINHAEISNSPHEFTMTVGKISTRFSPAQKQAVIDTGEVPVEPILQLIIPPTFLPALIGALEKQRGTYESAFGPIREPDAPAPAKS